MQLIEFIAIFTNTICKGYFFAMPKDRKPDDCRAYRRQSGKGGGADRYAEMNQKSRNPLHQHGIEGAEQRESQGIDRLERERSHE